MMYGLYNSFLVGDLIQQVSILLAIFVIVLVGLTLKRKGASTP